MRTHNPPVSNGVASPIAYKIVARITQVANRIEITLDQKSSKTGSEADQTASDLKHKKVSAATDNFMIEKKAITDIH